MTQPADQQGKVVVITGPSGAGKSSIVKRAVERTGAEFSVSATTRPPRPCEQDGREYHFVDRDRFREMAGSGELLEWAEVFGELYGTPAEPVRRAVAEGKTVVLDVDIQGGKQVHGRMPEATFVLVLPPGREELARRLRGRGTESEPAVQQRLAKADAEIAASRESGVYNHVIVNDKLDRAVQELVEILRSGSR